MRKPGGGARPRYPSSEGASANRIQPAGNGGTLESEASRPRLFSSSTAVVPCRGDSVSQRSRLSVSLCHTVEPARGRNSAREGAQRFESARKAKKRIRSPLREAKRPPRDNSGSAGLPKLIFRGGTPANSKLLRETRVFLFCAARNFKKLDEYF